jgi:hypothetical protein
MFVNVADRLFIATLLGIVYFGTHRAYPRLTVLLFVIVGAVLVWTTPNRWGVCTALHYLTRATWPDADDPIPSSTPPDAETSFSRRPPRESR